MAELKKPIIPPKNPSNLNFSGSKPNLDKPMTNESKLVHKTSVVESKRIPEKTVRGKNKKIIIISLVVILLAILIAVSTTMIVVYPTASRIKDINIDFTATSEFKPVEIESDVSGEPRQYALPGDRIEGEFTITAKRTAGYEGTENLDVFLRFKVSMDLEDNSIMSYDNEGNETLTLGFVDNVNTWTRGVDGYYYLNRVLSPGETPDVISVSKDFIISTAIGNEYAGKKVGIGFEAEVLQANYQAIMELWPTAPYIWSSQFRGLV